MPEKKFDEPDAPEGWRPTGRMMKVHMTLDPERAGVCSESLWAIRINATTAKIDNIPLTTTDFCLGDLVRIDDRGEIMQVLERGARTRRAMYPAHGSRKQVVRRWQKIWDHLARWDIEVEPAVPGVFMMAVPADIGNEELEGIFASCDVPLFLVPESPDDGKHDKLKS
jgi:hypothetical protein